MLTRDDIIILEDWLKSYRSWFDKIFVLDGSIKYKEESKKILKRYNCDYFHDEQFTFTKITDHTLRGVIFEKIRKYIPNNNLDYWIVIAHPDEFYIEHFYQVIDNSYKLNLKFVVYKSLHNFLHINDKNRYIKSRNYKDLQYFIHNEQNTFRENRIFLYNKNQYYSDKHSIVIPNNLKRYKIKNKFKCNPNLYHYKIYDINNFNIEGETFNSSWDTSSIKDYYSKNHKFNKIDDFFLENSYNYMTHLHKHKDCILLHKSSILPDSLKIEKESLFQIILKPYNKIPNIYQNKWKKKYSDYNYKIINEESGLEFLERYYNKDYYGNINNSVINAFNNGKTKWKCDLLRFCLLSRFSGLYLDCDFIPGKKLNLPNIDFISCIGAQNPKDKPKFSLKNYPKGEIAIGFIKVNSREPLLEEFIIKYGPDNIVQGEPYSFNIQNLYIMLCERWNIDYIEPFKIYIDPINKRKYYFLKETILKNIKGYKIVDKDNNIIFHSQIIPHRKFI